MRKPERGRSKTGSENKCSSGVQSRREDDQSTMDELDSYSEQPEVNLCRNARELSSLIFLTAGGKRRGWKGGEGGKESPYLTFFYKLTPVSNDVELKEIGLTWEGPPNMTQTTDDRIVRKSCVVRCGESN